MPAEVRPPSSVEPWPLTGTLRFSASLRRVWSPLPVQISTVGFLTAWAICCWTDGGMAVGIVVLLVPVLAEAFWRKVLRSDSSEVTLTWARMWVVAVPATESLPTVVGLVSQSSGLMPNLARPLALLPLVDDDEKPCLSFWKSAAGSW